MKSRRPDPIWIPPLIAMCIAFTGLSCTEDPLPGTREQIIDGRFARWPGSGALEGDAWRLDGEASLTNPSGHLRMHASVDTDGGAQTLVPVTPGIGYELSLRHKGGDGTLEVVLDDDGQRLTAELPASAAWTTVQASITPGRDGLRIRLLDAADGVEALQVDDVSLGRPALGEHQHEPPIQILTVVHAATDVGNADRYWERREALAAMAETMEAHGLRLTVLLSGPHAEWAWSLDDREFYVELQQRGHEIGTYVFPLYRTGHLAWESGDIFEPGMADAEWADHRAMVDELVDPATNRAVCAYAPMGDMAALMERHGFAIDLASVAVNELGGRSRESVAWSYLGHHPHHPFRPADRAVEGEELAADPGAPYASVGHAAQIGRSEAHGAPCELEDYQRIFSQLVDRWTAHQRVGAAEGDDLPWVFGAIHSPSQHEQFGSEFEAWLDHLSETALDATTPEGNVIAEGATASEVLAAFEAWELDHPGESAFSFTLPP
jgi:hypothetical protein